MSAWHSCSRRHRPARAIFMRPLEMKSNTLNYWIFSSVETWVVILAWWQDSLPRRSTTEELNHLWACLTRLGNRCDELAHHNVQPSKIVTHHTCSLCRYVHGIQKQGTEAARYRFGVPRIGQLQILAQESFSIRLLCVWVKEIHI